MAYAIKSLSDYGVSTHANSDGVADNINHLMGEHALIGMSKYRCRANSSSKAVLSLALLGARPGDRHISTTVYNGRGAASE
jgi:hypothetical protein